MTRTELADHFDYLDLLRESGATNMFGAAPYLVRDQGLPIEEARKVLSMWCDTFDRVKPADERAAAALAKSETER